MTEPSIIKFERAISDLPPLPVVPGKAYDSTACKHVTSVIDRDARRLTCKACGVELDPYQRLWELSQNHKGIDDRVELIKKYEQQKRETAERVANADQGRFPTRLARVQVGDYLSIETAPNPEHPGHYSNYRADVVRVFDDCFWIDLHFMSRKVRHSDIAKFRTLKKAARP